MSVKDCVQKVLSLPSINALIEATEENKLTVGNAVPAVPIASGYFIQFVADRLHAKLSSQGYDVPKFNSENRKK